MKTVVKSTTDPDCGLFVKGDHKKQLAYEAHTACDVHGVVLAVEVTPGTVHDSVAFYDEYDHVVEQFPDVHAFVADSATEVVEEERFSETVKQLASQIRSSGCRRYVLGGSTADDGSAPEKQQQFGLARAKFVKEAVAQVDPEAAEQLVPVGLGCANTSVRADDEEANRVVWFVEATSDLGQELLAVGIQ